MTKKAFYLAPRPAEDLFHPIAEKALLDHAYKMGYAAFMAYRHYNENPFNENDWQRSNAWDEGWATADNANPGKFDHSAERFNFTLPYIQGNPDCPF